MKTKSIIAALLLAASSVFAQVPSYVPTNGLVGWWPFNGNANDESGNGNNGTVNGASFTFDANGVNNSAINQTNNGDYIKTQGVINNVVNTFTISFWAKPAQADIIKSQGIVGNEGTGIMSVIHPTHGSNWGNASTNAGVGINVGNNQVQIVEHTHLYISSPLVYTSQIIGWHSIVLVYNQHVPSLYVDGNLVATGLQSSIQNIHPSSGFCNVYPQSGFGSSFSPNGNPIGNYRGQYDNIGIWNRALTQQEITALHNAQSCTSNTITADGPTTFCAGNFVNLTSDVVGGTYQWKRNGINITTNGTSKTYKATSTGSYTCVATCNGTALTSNAIAVTSKTNASASVSASGATSFCAGDSVTLNCTNLGSNYSVQWYRTNVSMENATAYSQVVKQPGTYKVVTKNLTNGCSRISGSSAIVAVNCRLANPDVIAADITESDFDAVTRESEPKGKIYIYPNPTSDNKFTVELMGLEVDGNATLEVYNAMGQILSSEKVNITNGTLNRTIQIDEQSKGQLCLVRLIAGSEVYDSKVILK